MKFAKAPRCLYDETHAQRAYFAAFVQFAKQEDVNLHMKNLASFASLREIKSIHPGWPSKGEATCKFCGLKTSVNGIINKILCIAFPLRASDLKVLCFLCEIKSIHPAGNRRP